jgi:hypothetical protein
MFGSSYLHSEEPVQAFGCGKVASFVFIVGVGLWKKGCESSRTDSRFSSRFEVSDLESVEWAG